MSGRRETQAAAPWWLELYWRAKVWWLGNRIKCMHGRRFNEGCLDCGEYADA